MKSREKREVVLRAYRQIVRRSTAGARHGVKRLRLFGAGKQAHRRGRCSAGQRHGV